MLTLDMKQLIKQNRLFNNRMKYTTENRVNNMILGIMVLLCLLLYHVLLLAVSLMINVRLFRDKVLRVELEKTRKIEGLMANKKLL